jgi:hypothetical protein
MATFLSLTEQQHINTIRTAAPLYMKGYSDLTKRSHMLFSMMESWGNIEYNAGDAARVWQVMVRQPDVSTFSNTTNKTFQDHSAFEQCTVGIRGYEATDVLKEKEYKLNQGQTQLINLYDFKMKNLSQSVMERLQEFVYRDGDANGQNGFQGFESCLKPENANTGGTDADGTASGDRIVLPKDSYAGLSTELGSLGGTWSTDLPAGERMNKTQGANNDWPYGIGSSSYDAFSPTLVAYNSTDWGATTWESNVEECVREAGTILRSKNGYQSGDIAILLAPNLYPAAENYYSTRFRIAQPYSGGDQGFPVPQSLYIDGVALKSEYGVPAGTGYIVCPQHTEMFFLNTMNGGGEGGAMLDVFGPDWSPEHGAYLFRISCFGNLRLQPKALGKLATIEHYNAVAA